MNVRRTWAAGLAAAVLVTIAGCADAQNDEPSPAPSAPGVDQSRLSPSKLPEAPTLENAKGAAKDATVEACDTGEGKREVSGTLKSSAKKTADYVVTVSWINDSYDVRGRGIAVLKDVKAGATKKFTVKADVLGGAAQCVTNVEYGQLKG